MCIVLLHLSIMLYVLGVLYEIKWCYVISAICQFIAIVDFTIFRDKFSKLEEEVKKLKRSDAE